jgi:murein endopeptidase
MGGRVLRFLPIAFVVCAVLTAATVARTAQDPATPVVVPQTQTAPATVPIAPTSTAAPTTGPQPAPPPARPAPRGPRQAPSRAVGLPFRGRLVRGVPLPSESDDYVTWDPVRHDSPNRAWRVYGTDRLVALVQRIAREFAAGHAEASRIVVGDLSLPRGGDFGRQYGGLGHGSHQNGLDVDVFYPRKDRCECAPTRAAEVDQVLAQDLVNRFVAAGASFVFVGPHLHLTGPRRVVQKLAFHDDHLHVRIPNPRRTQPAGAR